MNLLVTTLPEGVALHRAVGIDTFDTRTFYKLAQLRERVFIVEHECPYLELDGRDLEPDAVQLWIETDTGEIIATIRVLTGRITATVSAPTDLAKERKPTAAHLTADNPADTDRSASVSETAPLRVIGRVVTAPEWRGSGAASTLMRAALDECAGSPIELDAQSHLTGWYARFGFQPAGPEFLEDGIPHTPMRREASASLRG